MPQTKNLPSHPKQVNGLEANVLHELQASVALAQEEITREFAQALLMTTKDNRHLNEFTWRRYASMMEERQWLQLLDPICIDEEGHLTNGQHRLRAIVHTGIPQLMWVARNVPKEFSLFMDTGRSRRMFEILTMRGHGQVREGHVATLRVLLYGEALRQPTIAYKGSMTPDHLEAEFLKHRDAIDFPHEHLRSSTRGIATAGVRGALARAYYHVAHSELERFCEVLVSGIVSEPLENWAGLLRGQLLAESVAAMGRFWQYRSYMKTERAVYNYAVVRKTGERLVAAEHELFPLPEEEAKLAV